MNKALIEKVAEQLGYDEPKGQEFIDTCNDVANHGADGGFGQFIYYADTCAFFEANKKLIMSELKEMASSLGEDMFIMVTGFNCLKEHGLTTEDVADAIYNGDGEMCEQIQNALAWFALEEVARYVQDNARQFEAETVEA